MFLVFNSALKGLNDTPQPKSKAGARWIVLNVRDLNKTSTYIYCLCMCTLIVVNVASLNNDWFNSNDLNNKNHGKFFFLFLFRFFLFFTVIKFRRKIITIES